jgi:NAD(P)-dependent dehydrogenase (short-subunit alcohol dehydrogenase family)
MNRSPSSTTAESFRLDGKQALVTGGGSGIGAATCRELTKAGARVIVADANEEAAKRVALELGTGRPIHMDVTQSASIRAAFEGLERLDILVNSAGIGHVGDILHTEVEDFLRIQDVNVKGVYLATRFAFPLLLASHGSIVNVGSVAGLVGVKQRLAYCSSKGAVIAMTRQIAVDFPTELRINCVCPGTVETPFVENYLEKYHAHEKEKIRTEITARQPIGRLGKPEEVAAFVRYLCSAEAEFINGAVLPIDGGWSAA